MKRYLCKRICWRQVQMIFLSFHLFPLILFSSSFSTPLSSFPLAYSPFLLTSLPLLLASLPLLLASLPLLIASLRLLLASTPFSSSHLPFLSPAIFPIRFSTNENEQLTIESVSRDGRTITVTEPLRHHHVALRQTLGGRVVDTRAEVGLLSRNVRIRGVVSADFADDVIEPCGGKWSPGEWFVLFVCFVRLHVWRRIC